MAEASYCRGQPFAGAVQVHSLPATVRSVLSETGLAAKRLELEITEGVLLSNDEHVHDMIGGLKDIGVKLALDDFGTGYSSLSYLQRVPFDKIKIDQSFVRGASDPQSRNAALIRAMVGLDPTFTCRPLRKAWRRKTNCSWFVTSAARSCRAIFSAGRCRQRKPRS